MFKRIFLITVISISISSFCIAITPEEIFNKIKVAQAGINQVKCQIVSTSNLKDYQTKQADIKMPFVSTTVCLFYFKKPYTFRADYIKGDKIGFTRIYNGNEMLEYFPNGGQSKKTKTEVGKNYGYLVYFTDIVDRLKNNNALLCGEERIEEENCYIIQITKAGSSEKLWISKVTWLIKQVEVVDEKRNIFTSTFKGIEINPNLDNSLFNLTLSEGVKLINKF